MLTTGVSLSACWVNFSFASAVSSRCLSSVTETGKPAWLSFWRWNSVAYIINGLGQDRSHGHLKHDRLRYHSHSLKWDFNFWTLSPLDHTVDYTCIVITPLSQQVELFFFERQSSQTSIACLKCFWKRVTCRMDHGVWGLSLYFGEVSTRGTPPIRSQRINTHVGPVVCVCVCVCRFTCLCVRVDRERERATESERETESTHVHL